MKILLIFVIAVASWAGINSYNHQKLFSNPLAEKSAREKLIDAAKMGIDESGEFLQEKSNKLLEKSSQLATDAVKKGSQVVTETKDAAIQKYNKATKPVTQ